MNRKTRLATGLAIGAALAFAPTAAHAHTPTPEDYARAAEWCAPYYADPDSQGCPGPVIDAALHPETWCTPTTTPSCTNGPTTDAPLASTGPVPPAPGPAPSWDEQICLNYPNDERCQLVSTDLPPAQAAVADPALITDAPITTSDPTPTTNPDTTVAVAPAGAFLDAPTRATPDVAPIAARVAWTEHALLHVA